MNNSSRCLGDSLALSQYSVIGTPSTGSMTCPDQRNTTGPILGNRSRAQAFEDYLDLVLRAGIGACLGCRREPAAQVIVHDISEQKRANEEIRRLNVELEKRVAERSRRGTIDHFDRYMASDPARSERIEQFLVWIGQTFLNAITIVNNDLSDAELLAHLHGARSQPPSSRHSSTDTP